MKIGTVCVIGEGELAYKLKELLSKANLMVVAADLKAGYAKQAGGSDLVLELAPEDLAAKRKIFKSCDAKC
jgi:3-hydroxyacyl-CoA dehydrogenase